MNSSASQPQNGQNKRTSKTAILSFILGIAGLPLWGVTLLVIGLAHQYTSFLDNTFYIVSSTIPFVLLSVFAIVFGLIAKSRIAKNPDLKGRGFALIGIVAGIITLILLGFIDGMMAVFSTIDF
jgi:hypothetical protein